MNYGRQLWYTVGGAQERVFIETFHSFVIVMGLMQIIVLV